MNNNNNNGAISFFDMFKEDVNILAFDQEQKVIKDEIDKVKQEEKELTKIKEQEEKARLAAEEAKIREEKMKVAIEEEKNRELKAFKEKFDKADKVLVKVFGFEVFSIEEREEIDNITMDYILKKIIENGFTGFVDNKPKWTVELSEEDEEGKTIAYIAPVYEKLHSKG